ncbi:5-formyltetrahydrofolate cyclo-ligase [Thermosulfuriphilus sp.]
MESKKDLRKRFLEVRGGLSPEVRALASRKITESVLNWPLFRSVQVVLLYASFRDEVDTWGLFGEVLRLGKCVLLPRTFPTERRLRLYKIEDPERDLAPGYAGILEPHPGLSEADQAPELIFVPGVAFDCHGGRLGYGGGYYDRLLMDYPLAIRVGLAFSVQVVERLPLEEHDQLVDFLVTEQSFSRTRCGPAP